MASVDKHLICDDDGLALLFAPIFDQAVHDSDYPPLTGQ